MTEAQYKHKTQKQRRAVILRKRSKIRKAASEAGVICEWIGCNAYADDPHEVLSRGRGGSPVDVENIAYLCRFHHDRVTTNPTAAERLGLSRKRTPAEWAGRATA